MKIEITATVDGENIATATFEDRRLSGATFGPGMMNFFKDRSVGHMAELGELYAVIMQAVQRWLNPPKVTPTFIRAPKLLAVGEAATEPGNYRVVEPLAKKASDARDAFQKVIMSGDADTYDSLMDALRGVKLPEPPTETETAPNEGPAEEPTE